MNKVKKANKKILLIIVTVIFSVIVLNCNGKITIADDNEGSLLKDGIYKIEVQALKENKEELSMANTYLQKQASIDVEDKSINMTITLKRTNWMKNIKVMIEGKDVKHEYKAINKNDNSETDGTIKFKIHNLHSEIKLSMEVEPMGNALVVFRVVPQKDSLELVKEYANEEKNVLSELELNKSEAVEVSKENNIENEVSSKNSNKKMTILLVGVGILLAVFKLIKK